MKPCWDDMNAWSHCQLLEYDKIRQFEESEELSIIAQSQVRL